jgi:aconitase A
LAVIRRISIRWSRSIVIDHSVIIDAFGAAGPSKSMSISNIAAMASVTVFKWGCSFDNFRVVPPGTDLPSG